jgi:hypothetical protein
LLCAHVNPREAAIWLPYRRYGTMFLDGVRVDHGALSDLPIDALSHEKTQAVMRPDR